MPATLCFPTRGTGRGVNQGVHEEDAWNNVKINLKLI